MFTPIPKLVVLVLLASRRSFDQVEKEGVLVWNVLELKMVGTNADAAPWALLLLILCCTTATMRRRRSSCWVGNGSRRIDIMENFYLYSRLMMMVMMMWCEINV